MDQTEDKTVNVTELTEAKPIMPHMSPEAQAAWEADMVSLKLKNEKRRLKQEQMNAGSKRHGI